jgi:hypothetical protein
MIDSSQDIHVQMQKKLAASLVDIGLPDLPHLKSQDLLS